MFTGLIEEVGVITAVRRGARSASIIIAGRTIFSDLKTGDSVAVNGVCLTAVTIAGGATFTADIMHETLRTSSLRDLRPGMRVNLERAMPANGRFGGHIVSGHIDGIGEIAAIRRDDNAIWYTVKPAEGLMQFVIHKGSIAMDGISLTVAAAEQNRFSVSVIPHTAAVTTLGERRVGSIVNLEADPIGKYVLHARNSHRTPLHNQGMTRDFLTQNGF